MPVSPSFGRVKVCRWRSSAVERLICNQRVGGSIPSASSNRLGPLKLAGPAARKSRNGEVAKRPNATDCKSVAPRASKVRILPSPPSAARRVGEVDRETRSQAGVAQLVELQPSKLDVAGSNPVARSTSEAEVTGQQEEQRERAGFTPARERVPGGATQRPLAQRRRPRSSVGRARPW